MLVTSFWFEQADASVGEEALWRRCENAVERCGNGAGGDDSDIDHGNSGVVEDGVVNTLLMILIEG